MQIHADPRKPLDVTPQQRRRSVEKDEQSSGEDDITMP